MDKLLRNISSQLSSITNANISRPTRWLTLWRIRRVCCDVEQSRCVAKCISASAPEFLHVLIAAAESGETIVITRHGTPVATIAPQMSNRTGDLEWPAALAALE